MRVLFWGTPTFALPAFYALDEEGHDMVGVVTQPDRPAGRGQQLQISPVKRAALEAAVPVLQPERARGPEFVTEIQALHPDVSVVVAYGQILRPEVLEVPVHRSLNIHASLLPKLRGAAPIAHAIISGERETGITIMRMDAGMDTGPTLLQLAEPIRPEESASELAERLAGLGAAGIVEALARMEAGTLPEIAQNGALATYAPKLSREGARIRWSEPSMVVSRWIRGYDDVPGAWSELEGVGAVKLFRPAPEPGFAREAVPGTVLSADSRIGLLVATGDSAVHIREVQPPGKRRMSAGDWVRGRGIAAGAHFV